MSIKFSSLGGNTRITLCLVTAAVLCLAVTPVLAALPVAGKEIPWGIMGMRVFGGLALFLFGMDQMSEALKAVAGDRMRGILGKLTNNRVAGLVTGAGVTAVIQSSSVTTVMLVGFVTAGLMSLSQAIGVILGADIGTTITAQIVAFPVKKYALLLVTIGFVMMFVGRSEKIKQYGVLTMGLGMIFFGLAIMSDAMKPLRSYQPFIQLMQDVANPLVGILIATIFTALIQSSSATMGVVIVLAQQGLISLEGGIALALGANIGTCATAGLASIGKPREAVRVAVAHVTFKIVGVALIFFFIPYLAEFCRWISPAYPELTGMERLAKETPRQVANAHTLFNVGIAFLFLPATTLFARFCEWVVADKPEEAEELPVHFKPRYLDEALISTPPLALGRCRLEIGRLGKRVIEMFDKVLPAVLNGSKEDLQEIVEIDDEVDVLHGQIVLFLGKLSMTNLSAEQAEELMYLLQTVDRLENVGDIMETNMVSVGTQRINENIVVSDPTMKIINQYHQQVAAALLDTVEIVSNEDIDAIKRVRSRKGEIDALALETAKHEIERLTADAPNRLKTYTRERETIDHMDRIYRTCRSIAGSAPTKEELELQPEETTT
ncbi:MAG TPA: Na/Pi cotransporter family protein [Rhodospirillales bacterium]|nr:Na/Pi cotransporter family protein [Rhodospirillales bacterium]